MQKTAAAAALSPIGAAEPGRVGGPARRRIWEIGGPSHCSIIGTCLTLGELRKMARRTGFLVNEARYRDHHIHGLFVEKMYDENTVSRAIQKHLDAKFEGAIRKAKPLDGDEAFLVYWESGRRQRVHS